MTALYTRITRHLTNGGQPKFINCLQTLNQYGTKFWNVLLRPERTNANIILIQLGSIGLGMNIIFILYLIQYLPNYSKHKIQVDYNVWNVYCPKMIPIITVVGVVTFLLYVRGTYPVWGFLSPFILCIVSIGILNVLHFIPSSFVPSILWRINHTTVLHLKMNYLCHLVTKIWELFWLHYHSWNFIGCNNFSKNGGWWEKY